MPYYLEDDPGWDEGEDDEPERGPPKLSQFHYSPPFRLLPGPKVVRVQEPVSFSDRIPPPPAFPLARAEPERPGFLDRLLGRRQRAPAQAPPLTLEQQKEAARHRGQHLLALVVLALRETGVRRVYCRYDGGHDEGFAWVDHAETSSGERLATELVARRLARTRLLKGAVRAGLWRRRQLTRARELRDIADWAFAQECAVRLLGPFGNGPMLLYGAFTVDLDACTIADDPNADPVTPHFRIEA